jgi:hypothetical protein
LWSNNHGTAIDQVYYPIIGGDLVTPRVLIHEADSQAIFNDCTVGAGDYLSVAVNRAAAMMKALAAWIRDGNEIFISMVPCHIGLDCGSDSGSGGFRTAAHRGYVEMRERLPTGISLG